MEIIVAVAPSTTDRTREVVEKYAPTAKWVTGGMPAAGRNKGAKAASGDIIVFFDADVLPCDRYFLARATKEMESRNLDFATVDNLPNDRRLLHRAFYLVYNSVQRTAPKFKQQYAIGTCIIARREAHNAIGGFDERIAFAEDTEYVQRAVKRGYSFDILKRSIHIKTSPRRFEKDGVINTARIGLRAERYRRKVGEITDIRQIDPEYFEHRKRKS